MLRATVLLLCILISISIINAQYFGSFSNIEKNQLLDDLELLYQGLDKFHTGMYWYSSKLSVESAFREVEKQIQTDLNTLEFHKLIAPLVALSREDHTDISLPKKLKAQISEEASFLPLTFVFLGNDLYCVNNGSDLHNLAIEGKLVESINGETPIKIADKISSLFASDGFIKTVKYRDLEGFSFSRHYFYYYGILDTFEIKFKKIEQPIKFKALKVNEIRTHLKSRYPHDNKKVKRKILDYQILKDSIAYIYIRTFDNQDIKNYTDEKTLALFLKNSFQSIFENNLKTLILDVSNNTGGSEGNEGLLYSYFGNNYQKYKKVKVKSQKVILDNGKDQPIKLKAYGFWERIFTTKKMPDGSLERKKNAGFGLMAYKKEPQYKFSGKTYVIISPITYSAGSEFSNMMSTNNLATFVGQETGGGYAGNTSGYSKTLVLPNSKIEIEIPTIQFIMNVKPNGAKGRGVMPDIEVIPTIEQYLKGENAPLLFIQNKLIATE